MKAFIVIVFLLFIQISYAESIPTPTNKIVLEVVSQMPNEGGYELTIVPAKKMRDAFSWKNEILTLNPFKAVPSYCTTATYMVFFKVLEKYWELNNITPSLNTQQKLKPNLEDDGTRIWGRWNSNGPGTAKLLADAQIGTNFDDINNAIPGDFIKIFWNGLVGKLEKGHTGIYLGKKIINGQEMLHFWASSNSTSGFSERIIPMKDAKKILFSRLDQIENYERIGDLPDVDNFLADMLVRESSWDEVKEVSRFK